MRATVSTVEQVLVLRLDPHEDVLLSLRQAVAQQGIHSALLLGAAGSVDRYCVHVVDNVTPPFHDTFLHGEGPLDILSLNGAVLNGRVHAHISFAGAHEALGGHLEEGCRILTFGMIWLATTPNADLTDWDRPGKLE
ncbi:MAG: PPC domain-containing DNA-binding protein [Anaerolineae bacterium]